MQIRVRHHLGDLERDQMRIVKRAPRDMVSTVREGIRAGNSIAQERARAQEGRHGKHFHKAFTTEMHGPQSTLGGNALYSGEYGPDISKPQGGLAFEDAPGRQRRPHRNMRTSFDLIAPVFAAEVGRLPDRWFW